MGTLFDREHEPPSSSDGDAALGIAKVLSVMAAAFAGPAAGAAIAGSSELLKQIFGTPLAHRRAEWEQGIADSVRRLERERGISPEALRDNPAFIDAALSAYQSFVRTSQREKRQALLNAVLNAGLSSSPDTKRQEMFMSFLERFTATHLALLGLLHSPATWTRHDGRRLPLITGGEAKVIVLAAFDDAQQLWPVYEQAWSDLFAAGLVKTPKIGNGLEGPPSQVCRTTDIGKEFLKFIATPLAE